MTIVTDYDKTIETLRERVGELEQERDDLSIAIAEHVEALGGEGNDRTALQDSRGQLERLLEGKDIDAGLDLEGIARELELKLRKFFDAPEQYAFSQGSQWVADIPVRPGSDTAKALRVCGGPLQLAGLQPVAHPVTVLVNVTDTCETWRVYSALEPSPWVASMKHARRVAESYRDALVHTGEPEEECEIPWEREPL